MSSSLEQREQLRQRQSNRNAQRFTRHFASHRAELTRRCRLRGTQPPGSRLCVLGAGNALDLDLERLASEYREVHLVDIDGEALERAVHRQSPRARARISLHPGLDLSGFLPELENLRDLRVNERAILEHPRKTSAAVASEVGTGFDTVLSACVLSQMHLGLREALSDAHPLFAALTYTLNLTHLLTLLELCAAGGRAVLASDAADERLAPLDPESSADCLRLLQQLALAGQLFDAVDPMALGTIVADNPELAGGFAIRPIRDAWRWQIAPGRIFLVYALELERSSSPVAR